MWQQCNWRPIQAKDVRMFSLRNPYLEKSLRNLYLEKSLRNLYLDGLLLIQLLLYKRNFNLPRITFKMPLIFGVKKIHSSTVKILNLFSKFWFIEETYIIGLEQTELMAQKWNSGEKVKQWGASRSSLKTGFICWHRFELSKAHSRGNSKWRKTTPNSEWKNV